MDAKELIARRVASNFTTARWSISESGCDLGFALRAARDHVAFQSENGIIGFGAPRQWHGGPASDRRRRRLYFSASGAASFDSSTSFALIRGGTST